MITSTPESPGPKGPPSILLRGSPGCGKTTLAMQFPNVCILDCDENLSGPETYIRTKIDPKFTYSYFRCRFDDSGKPLEKEALWKRYIEGFNQAVADPNIKTIVTDSLTGLDQMLLRYIMKQQNIEDANKLERQHWIPFRMQMQELTLRMRNTGKINIVNAHETEKTNSRGIPERYDVAITSRLRDHFGWIFTEVWYMESLPPLAGKKRDPMLYLTSPGGLRPDLKSSNPNTPATLEGNWPNVKAQLGL